MDDADASWYKESYSSVSVTGKPGRGQDKLHHLMEAGFDDTDHYAKVLEVGGNRGEHVGYVRHSYDEYILTDLRQPPDISAAHPLVRSQAADAQDLPFDDATFDRSITTCVLHHLPDAEAALTELRRVTRPGGVVTILLPTDPGLAYRATRELTTVRSARAAGIAKEANRVHARAHRGNFWSLKELIEDVFEQDHRDVRYWPLKIPSWNLNILTIWNIRI